jgi:hypothetical protein
MPEHVKPADIPEQWVDADSTDDLSHIIAISMNKEGFPIRLFTVNRWVTGEWWYDADAVIELIDAFEIDHAWPSWPTNIWLTQMVRRYKSQICELVRLRDQNLKAWQSQHPDVNPFEDRRLEVLSSLDL